MKTTSHTPLKSCLKKKSTDNQENRPLRRTQSAPAIMLTTEYQTIEQRKNLATKGNSKIVNLIKDCFCFSKSNNSEVNNNASEINKQLRHIQSSPIILPKKSVQYLNYVTFYNEKGKISKGKIKEPSKPYAIKKTNIKNSTQNTNDTIPKPPERRQSLDNATATMQNTNDTIPKSPERRQSLDNQNNDNDMQQAIINSLIISRKK